MNNYDVEEYIESEKPVKRRHRRMAFTAVILAALLAITSVGLLISSANSTKSGSADKAPVALTLSAPAEQAADETSSPGYYLIDATAVVENMLPSVVSITTRELVEYYNNYGGSYGGNFNDIIEYFFGGDSYGGRGGNNGGNYYGDSYGGETDEGENENEEPVEIEAAMGSGTIVAKNDTELLILTSFHVVEGSSSLYVTFINDDSADGYVKAADEERDIAIVAIPLENISDETMDSIKVATICTEEPSVGEGVLVIGNALGYGISVTSGIVSAVEREIYVEGKLLTVMQTDAAINEGNSGGCLINSKGEVIGISEAKVYDSLVEGMCYAIPVAANLDVIQELLNAEGRYDENKSDGQQDPYSNYNGAFLGIRGRDVTNETANDYGMPLGVYVSSTVDGSGAQDAGIQGGDIIVGIDGTELTTMDELQYELSSHKAGDTVALDIKRLADGEYVDLTVDVTLTDRIS